MKLKLVVSLLAVLSLFGVSTHAQDTPKVDIFAGYSYVRNNPSTSGVSGFSLNGGSASIAYNAKSWLSGVADFGAITAVISGTPGRAGRSRPIFLGLAFPFVTSGA